MANQVPFSLAAAAFVVALASCSSTRAVRDAEGNFHLECHGSLAACAKKADHLCGDNYVILSGRVARVASAPEAKHPSPSDRAELVVRCGGTSQPAATPSAPPSAEPSDTGEGREQPAAEPEPLVVIDAGSAPAAVPEVAPSTSADAGASPSPSVDAGNPF
jgi:hypothetical protein